MNDLITDLTKDLTKELERDIGLKLTGTKALAGGTVNPATTRQHIDDVIAGMQMTIRILEEAKKRL